MPLLNGEVGEVNEEVYSEVTFHAAYEPKRAVRTHRMKYIRRFDGRSTAVLPNCDDGLSKDVWLEFGWAERPIAEEQLYDLVFDPGERHNLVDDPNYVSALEDMRQRLQAWMKRTDDPLLDGPVPPARGAKYNDVDGLSPHESATVAPD